MWRVEGEWEDECRCGGGGIGTVKGAYIHVPYMLLYSPFILLLPFLLPSLSLFSLSPPAPVDRAGFWGTLTGMLKRRKKRYSLEDGVYLDDLNDETMDPEELSKFFPSA